MMKKILFILMLSMMMGQLNAKSNLPFTRQETKNIMRKIADWQIADL